MTLADQENSIDREATDRSKQERWHKVCIWSSLVKFLVLTPLVVILSYTVFKVKPPKIQLLSTTVQGISPRVYFPVIKVDLNVTLKFTILVHNPNHVSFKANQGVSSLLYKDVLVGDVQVDPGTIPAKGSAALVCLLTLEADRFAGFGLLSVIKDIMDGEIGLKVITTIPGKAKILIFRKRVVTISDCGIVIGFPDVKIISQDCKQRIKL